MRLLRPVSHVIFDLDGVLLDTEPLYTQATQRVVAPFGKSYGWDIKKHCMGRAERISAGIILEQLGLDLSVDAYMALRREHLRQLFPTAPGIPGAQELVAALQSAQIPLAIATSSISEFWHLKTDAHPWIQEISVVVRGDDPELRAAKPAPDIFLLAARRLGAEPRDCLVFEDAPAGVEAARSAGMQVVALVDPHLDRELFREATLVIQSYEELGTGSISAFLRAETP